MKAYTVNELRRMFLDFFEKNGHLVMKSFSLVPHNDNSLLLINAGMAPLKPYFTGQEIPPRKRVCTCQKCVRTGDIENVGKTARHMTFFEMLGNFSFGDYFKKEALHWSWEFLTQTVGLDPELLYPSIYFDDEEAFDIWTKDIGVPAEKITRFYREEDGSCDNFWEHGAGPCGPCSEIYYDRGIKYGCGKPDCRPGCDCDRFVEVWNDVFTQFESDGKGNYTELKQKNIDTGMGLERLALVVQGADTVFDIDSMKAIRDSVCKKAGKEYHSSDKDDVSIRLITDHIRSATFLISDGVMPSNEGRGYVLRRLIRRAARHGKMLGIEGTFLADISGTVIDLHEDGYPELREKQEFIFRVMTEEEEQFAKTIDQGLSILSDMEKDMAEKGEKTLSGENAFKLYDTYGFPPDLTEEILSEKGLSMDQEGFEACMNEQKERARAARKKTNYMGADPTVYESLPKEIKTEFTGYDALEGDARVLALTSETAVVQALSEGEKGTIVVDKTPFYATMGGQIGDTGIITTKDGEFKVTDTIKLVGDKTGHIGVVTKGMIRGGVSAHLAVDADRRARIAKNHSATHLLQKALREVLGTHVEQAGSEVRPERLRFDFTHFSAMTDEELLKVEKIVNDKIAEDLAVVTDIMSLEDAKKTGAMALFGEKYGDTVRVVRMGDFSTELCGGTHVARTGSIQAFKLVSEAGIAAGVRRIEALTGDAVFESYHNSEKLLSEASAVLKTEPSELASKIKKLLEEKKALASELESYKAKEASAAADETMKSEDIGGMKFMYGTMEGVSGGDLRGICDTLKDKIGEGVIFIASVCDGKVNMIASATDGAVSKGAHAGMIIKAAAAVVGGGGGGRPGMAQAGGKDASKIPDAIDAARDTLKSQIN